MEPFPLGILGTTCPEPRLPYLSSFWRIQNGAEFNLCFSELVRHLQAALSTACCHPMAPAFLLRIHKIGHLSIGNKAVRVLCIFEPES